MWILRFVHYIFRAFHLYLVFRKVTKTDFVKENPASAAYAALTQTPEKPAEGVTSPTSPISPIVEPHILLKPPCAFYKPAEYPDSTSLTVIPTFVDYGCIIYVHVLNDGDTGELCEGLLWVTNLVNFPSLTVVTVGEMLCTGSFA